MKTLQIARAFVSRTASSLAPVICVGRDGRLSSPLLHEAVCEGILDSGFDLIGVYVEGRPVRF